MENKKPLIVLTGPTAVGKTDISIRLAKAIGGEIISADSMQVYKGMDIGTAKITPAEMDGVKHYLIDCFEPEDDFNVVIFQQMAKAAIEQIYRNGHIPIIVGGTGFYIQSVLYDIEFDICDDGLSADILAGSVSQLVNADETVVGQQSVNDDKTAGEHLAADNQKSYREYLYSLAEQKGAEYLHNMLKEIDEASAQAIHANNVKRVVRAIEYYHQTGKKISEHNSEQQQKESPYNYIYFVLNDDRELLYQRIDKRVDIMFEQGLESEMKALIDRGLTKDMVSMQGIGYKEMFGYFEGEYDLERAKYLIKLDTRHFAKRQITWFKREKSVTWINYQDYGSSKENVLEAMLEMINEKIMANE